MQTRDVSIYPNDRIVQNTQGASVGDYEAPYGGSYPSGPNRIAVRQANWSGFQYWQTWDNLEFPNGYREYISKGSVVDTVGLLISRNAPQQYAAAPIAIQQYALNTQQVYNGGSGYGNG